MHYGRKIYGGTRIVGLHFAGGFEPPQARGGLGGPLAPPGGEVQLCSRAEDEDRSEEHEHQHWLTIHYLRNEEPR